LCRVYVLAGGRGGWYGLIERRRRSQHGRLTGVRSELVHAAVTCSLVVPLPDDARLEERCTRPCEVIDLDHIARPDRRVLADHACPADRHTVAVRVNEPEPRG